MLVLKNKMTGELVDPRTVDFVIEPADLGFDSWDEALAADRETDIVDGYAVVESHLYYIWTDDGQYDDIAAASVAEALGQTDLPEAVRTAEQFVAWLEAVGGYGEIREDGETIAHVSSN